jgi:uncharacterized membrane protein YfcA
LLEPVTTAVILVALGLGAGTLGSMVGVGGGIIIAPVLTFMGLPPTQIASTSLFAVTSTSISSTIEYSRQKKIEYRLGLEMAALSIPGAVIGAFVSESVSLELFKLWFGILLILTGIYVLYRNAILKKNILKKQSIAKRILVFGITFGAGILSSLFGVGGGIIYVPAMLIVLGMTIQRGAPTSQLTLMMTSFAGIFAHSYLGHPDYLQAAALAAGAFAGGQIGARISKSAKETVLTQLLGLVLIAVSVKLIFDWLTSR